MEQRICIEGKGEYTKITLIDTNNNEIYVNMSTIINALNKTNPCRRVEILAKDIDGTEDIENSLKYKKDEYDGIEMSGDFYVRYTWSKDTGNKLGSGVTIPIEPSEFWNRYKDRRCSGHLYITSFNGKKILGGNVIDIDRLADEEIMQLARIPAA